MQEGRLGRSGVDAIEGAGSLPSFLRTSLVDGRRSLRQRDDQADVERSVRAWSFGSFASSASIEGARRELLEVRSTWSWWRGSSTACDGRARERIRRLVAAQGLPMSARSIDACFGSFLASHFGGRLRRQDAHTSLQRPVGIPSGPSHRRHRALRLGFAQAVLRRALLRVPATFPAPSLGRRHVGSHHRAARDVSAPMGTSTGGLLPRAHLGLPGKEPAGVLDPPRPDHVTPSARPSHWSERARDPGARGPPSGSFFSSVDEGRKGRGSTWSDEARRHRFARARSESTSTCAP
mmetsp:Transcript_7586/g.46662  ORF Transcript_7586/g.46662 Transcript_7586/m.46662 type:complete len:293 (+) Transcript_7586:3334-4212(+)